MSRYTAGFDAALLSGAAAEQTVRVAASIEAMAAAVKSLAAARAVAGQAWKGSGERSPAHHLARTTGVSVGQAADMIDTARRLEKLPEVAAAARSGQLSPQQTSAIADAATADPAAERRLLDQAQESPLHELREECARTKAASVPDLEARRKAIHARRFLPSYTDSDGAWNLRMRNNPEVGAAVMAPWSPSATACSPPPAPRVDGSRPRPTPPTPWWRRRAAAVSRWPTAAQRTALEWLYPTCAIKGCSSVTRLEMDHRIDWANTHVTLLDLLDLLCGHHHRRKTRDGWALVERRGKRAFVPPDDPRHPRHAAGDGRSPPSDSC